MNWLPIVERELRVAARKRSTFWLRVAAALTGLGVGAVCLLLSGLQGVGTAQMGSTLFEVLTWLCLAAGLCAGLFFTSDCLSEEKREGTLGLLFLTELRGFDVALGKLAATSLRTFYALLAVLPMLAVTQLMGGITGAQYWKSALALLDGLVLSLAAGLLVSALSRDSQKALAGTLLLLLLLVFGGLIADASIAGAKSRPFHAVWSLASPGYVLACAGAWGRSPYWSAVLTTQGLAWAMLVLACVLVPYTWQERRPAHTGKRRGWWYGWKYGGLRRRQRLRAKLLERWPVAWLGCRERWQAWAVWSMALLTLGGFVALLLSIERIEGWVFWNYLGGLLILVLYLWAASQACRFLAEARRNGLLELLLATPVNERDIVRGQWRALVRMFAVPVLLLVGLQVGGATLSHLSFQRIAAQANAAASSMRTNTSGTRFQGTVMVTNAQVSVSSGTKATPAGTTLRLGSTRQELWRAVVVAVLTALCTVGNLLALCWFGMWMAMTSRSANLATLKTVLFVQIIPWFVISVAATIVVGVVLARMVASRNSAQPGTWLEWWPLLTAALGTVAALGKDFGFILWSRNKLRSAFREQAAHATGEARFALPPSPPRPVDAPPVILAPQ